MNNFDEWILSGGGMQGESYFHKSNPDIFLKLFEKNIDRSVVEREFHRNEELWKYGIRCPKAFRMVTIDNRYGIIFQRINDKKSFSRASGDNPEMIPVLAKKLAEMGKSLHCRSAVGSPFPSALTTYRKLLDEDIVIDTIDKNLRQQMEDAWEFAAREDQCTFIHGDFHFGNAITDGKDYYFIDLGSCSYGNPKFDLAMFYFITHYGSEAVVQENYHMNVAGVMQFWNEFKKNYYAKEIPDRDLMREFKPYLLLKTLWILKEVGDFPFVRTIINIFSQDNPTLEDRTF